MLQKYRFFFCVPYWLLFLFYVCRTSAVQTRDPISVCVGLLRSSCLHAVVTFSSSYLLLRFQWCDGGVKKQALSSAWPGFEFNFVNWGKVLKFSRFLFLFKIGIILSTLHSFFSGLNEIIHINNLVQGAAQIKNAKAIADIILFSAICLLITVY